MKCLVAWVATLPFPRVHDVCQNPKCGKALTHVLVIKNGDWHTYALKPKQIYCNRKCAAAHMSMTAKAKREERKQRERERNERRKTPNPKFALQGNLEVRDELQNPMVVYD